MLRSLEGDRPKQWDHALAQADFSYNDSPNRSTAKSPFQIVYDMHPRGICEPRDLGIIEHRSGDGKDFATSMSELHEQVKKRLQDTSYRYKQ